MIANKLKKIEAARAQIAALEESVAAELNQELAALPAQYGFDNVNAFIKAVKAAGGKSRKRLGKGKAKATKVGDKRRTRAVITDATRAEVKKLVEAGKSGGVIAKELGISLPSVQNIKKALGLVKARKK